MNKRYKGHQSDLFVKIAVIAFLMGMLMPVIARIKHFPNKWLILGILGVVFLLIVVVRIMAWLIVKMKINKITAEQLLLYFKAREKVSAKVLSAYGEPPIRAVAKACELEEKLIFLIFQNDSFLMEKYPDVIENLVSEITREDYSKFVLARDKLEKERVGKELPSVRKKEIAEEAGIDLMTVAKIVLYSIILSEKFPDVN